MKFLFSLLILLLPFSALAAKGGFTVGDLEENCQVCAEDFKTGEKSVACSFCDGVLTGVASTYVSLEGNKSVCPPESLDTHRVRNMFRLWVKNHQDNMADPAVWGVIESLKESFPCAGN